MLNLVAAQITVSEITGLLSINTPFDSTSIYVGSRSINPDFYTNSGIKENVIIGNHAADSSGFIRSSVIMGSESALHMKQGLFSTIIGKGAMNNTMASLGSVAIGNDVFQKGVDLSESVAIGSFAAKDAGSIGSSVLIGFFAGADRTEFLENSVGIGHRSLYLSSGGQNTAIGQLSGSRTEGVNGIFLGVGAGKESKGLSNIMLGSSAGIKSNGMSNINIGQYSGIASEGDYNIYIGSRAGQNITGSSNIVLGKISDITPKDLSDVLLITNTNGHPYIIGDRSGDSTTFNTNNFIIRAPIFDNGSDRLQVRGNASISGQHTIGSLKIVPAVDDDGIISSDDNQPSSDLLLKSNDKVIIDLDINDDENSTFSVRNSTGVTIFDLEENGNLTLIGTLSHTSDVNLKKEIKNVDNNAILKALKTVEISTWKYKHDNVTHVGPMAQDFYRAFGLGSSSTSIATVDADGVALAAIQALAQENDQLKSEVESLKNSLIEIMAIVGE